MKRFIPFLLAAVLLALVLSPLTAFADGTTITVSEDLKTIKIDKYEYHRYNGSVTEYYHRQTTDYTLTFEGDGGDGIVRYDVRKYNYTLSYEIEYYYEDGSSLTSYYLRSDYIDTFNKVDAGIGVECKVEIGYWEDEIEVTFDRADLFGEKVDIKNLYSRWHYNFSVYTEASEIDLQCFQGYLLYMDDEFWFVDPEEQPYSISVTDEVPVTGYKIIDPELLEKLNAAMDEYMDEEYDLSFFSDGDLADALSTVMLVTFFVLVPLAAAVVSLIFIFRRRTDYVRLYSVIAALALSLLITVGVIILMVL